LGENRCVIGLYSWIWLIKDSKDDPLSKIFEHNERYVEPDPSSDPSLSYETRWRERCCSEHITCPSEVDHPLPTRVLDLTPDSGSQNPALFISEGRLGRWVALSHCWGGEQPMKTTTGTLEARQAGIQLEELPQTFVDAVTITKRLGFRYLWIDSLCIIQDSKADWAKEASRMGSVYKHAALTISANLAVNCRAGILQWRDIEPTLALPCKQPSTNTAGHIQVRTTKLPEYDVGTIQKPEFDYTAQRGWVLQEERLSPRSLRFTKFGKQWICHEANWDERRPAAGAMRFGSQDTPNKVIVAPSILLSDIISQWKLEKPKDKTNEEIFTAINLWYAVVADFLERNLTYETDCFPALSGLTKEIQNMTRWMYRAGIWMEDVHAGLLWAVGGLGQRTRGYVAPSWSWASLTLNKSSPEYENLMSPQIYQYRPYLALRKADPDAAPDAEIIDVSITNIPEDRYGEIESGSLTLRGLWKDANNEIFAHALRQSPNYYGSPIVFLGNSLYEPFDPIKEGHPVLNFDYISHEEFDQEQEQFKKVYDEKLGRATGDEDGLWSRMSFVQICLAAPMPDEAETGDGAEQKYLWVHYALILEPTGLVSGEFRRIGVALVPESLGTEGWVMREIKIV